MTNKKLNDQIERIIDEVDGGSHSVIVRRVAGR